MAYRLVGHASERMDEILLDSARRWGIDAADRYGRLILAAMGAAGDDPLLPNSRAVPRVAGLRSYHIRWARRLIEPRYRVGEPRHLIIYRVAPDGVVEVLSVVHDRMLLPRAARNARRDADG